MNICGPNLILLMIAIKWWLPGLGLCSSLVMISHTCALPQTSAQFSDIRYRLKLLKQFLQFLTLLNMAFSFLRIFYCNFLHDMRLVENVRLPSFSSKTDADFASYARKCHDGWLK